MKALVTLILGIMIAVSTGAQVRNQGTTSSRNNERTTTSTHTNTRHANENGNRNNHGTQTNTNKGTTSNVNNVGSVTNQSVKPSGTILKDAQIVKPGSNNSHGNSNGNNHNNNGYSGGGNHGYNGGHYDNHNHGYHPNSNPGYKPHSPAGAPMHHHVVNPYAHYGYVFRPSTVSLRSYYVTRPSVVTTTLIVSIFGISDIDVQRLSMGLPTRFNVVNEYGMFERRFASHADLQLAVRAIGTDYRGRTEYILELVDLHDLSMIATWGVDNFFSDPKWNIERCLDSNRYEIQRIMTEWDRYHYY